MQSPGQSGRKSTLTNLHYSDVPRNSTARDIFALKVELARRCRLGPHAGPESCFCSWCPPGHRARKLSHSGSRRSRDIRTPQPSGARLSFFVASLYDGANSRRKSSASLDFKATAAILSGLRPRTSRTRPQKIGLLAFRGFSAGYSQRGDIKPSFSNWTLAHASYASPARQSSQAGDRR